MESIRLMDHIDFTCGICRFAIDVANILAPSMPVALDGKLQSCGLGRSKGICCA